MINDGDGQSTIISVFNQGTGSGLGIEALPQSLLSLGIGQWGLQRLDGLGHGSDPAKFSMKTRRLDELIGTRSVRRDIRRGDNPIEIAKRWKADEREFGLKRKKYLLYP